MMKVDVIQNTLQCLQTIKALMDLTFKKVLAIECNLKRRQTTKMLVKFEGPREKNPFVESICMSRKMFN